MSESLDERVKEALAIKDEPGWITSKGYDMLYAVISDLNTALKKAEAENARLREMPSACLLYKKCMFFKHEG